MYILASFIKDKVTICAWVYLWAFYPVPLIYISVFVSVPYCLFFFFYTFSFLKKLIYLTYLFLAALGLHCCAWAFSSCGEWGLLFVAVHGLLVAVASLVVEHGL